MNQEVNCSKLYILAAWILLASTSCRLSCDARITTTVKSKIPERQLISSPNSIKSTNQIAHQLFTDFPSSNSQFQPPFCIYPPPPHTPSPPSSLQPPPADVSSPLPPYTKPEHAVWCVAKPTVPASVMQQALDYACASGADCEPIRLNGLCYQPATVLAHASYAFNSYWQRTKRAGATCDFGGSAMLVTVDPSKYFIYTLSILSSVHLHL
ncbi:hypothetical protein CDL12_05122 [Handroanthus impetiginosus]|uniref:X8 domain-containing protein n=1 Tax=Handroanthus impetiginosus TaxID=429701 RepID=A0A2G9HXD6_9LAMI|nr:hypothetical protein CDL12_05122 [Handroanthus impetiginosus]